MYCTVQYCVTTSNVSNPTLISFAHFYESFDIFLVFDHHKANRGFGGCRPEGPFVITMEKEREARRRNESAFTNSRSGKKRRRGAQMPIQEAQLSSRNDRANRPHHQGNKNADDQGNNYAIVNDNALHMIVLRPSHHEIQCQLLTMALLQVASKENRPSNIQLTPSTNSGKASSCTDDSIDMDRKVIDSLARTLSETNSNQIYQNRLVHIMEDLQHCHPNLLAKANHFVLVLTENDVSTLMVQASLSCKPTDDTTSGVLLDHYQTWLRQKLSCLPNAQDYVTMQRISIVLLLEENQETSASTTTMSLVAEAVTSTAGGVNSKASSSTLLIPTFVCRPDQPSSCQTVARMLWRRLELGQRETNFSSPLLVL